MVATNSLSLEEVDLRRCSALSRRKASPAVVTEQEVIGSKEASAKLSGDDVAVGDICGYTGGVWFEANWAWLGAGGAWPEGGDGYVCNGDLFEKWIFITRE